MLFFLNKPRFLVESAFYITKKGGGESFGKLKDKMKRNDRGKAPWTKITEEGISDSVEEPV